MVVTVNDGEGRCWILEAVNDGTDTLVELREGSDTALYGLLAGWHVSLAAVLLIEVGSMDWSTLELKP